MCSLSLSSVQGLKSLSTFSLKHFYFVRISFRHHYNSFGTTCKMYFVMLASRNSSRPCCLLLSKRNMITEIACFLLGLYPSNVRLKIRVAKDCKRSEDGKIIKIMRVNIC